MAVLSHHSRLACCRVAVFLGVGYAVLTVCRLMVKEVDTIDDVGETGQIGGIRTVGIGTGASAGRTRRLLGMTVPSSVTQSSPALMLFICDSGML